MNHLENILEARQIRKVYAIDGREIPILNDISFTVSKGDFLVIKGSSGSGKTTLLSILSGLDHPTDGQVLIEGKDITGMSEDDLALFRNRVFGFVFQSFHLVPSLTVMENIMFPAELGNPSKDKATGKDKKDDAPARAETLLERVGLSERASHYPHQLSGGEKQRTALCRALINRPRIIFADEPTGNLDSENSRIILDLLLALREERGAALVMVTHSSEVAGMADRVIHLKDGVVERWN